jgi:hypothetical protein
MCVAFFGLLAAESVTGFALGAETDALRDLHAESPDELRSVMRFVSTVGGGGGVSIVAVLLVGGLLLRRRWPKAALFAIMMIGASAALVALTWQSRWRLPVLIAGALVMAIVGFSRLVLGAHYPSDVLGGWAFAFAWVGSVYLFARRRLPTSDS